MTILKPFLVCCLTLALAGAAAAHGKKEESVPADGATLAAAPESVVVRFDQPHRVTLLELVDPSGAVSRLTVAEGMAATREISAALPAVAAPGAYEVKWRALAEDGHMVEDAIRFTYAPPN